MKASIDELKKNSLFTIKYEGKLYTIDLSRELSINENIINTQLKQSASSYSFLSLLRNKAIRKRDKLEKEKDEAYSRAWVSIKESNRALSNDLVSHKANINPKYQGLLKKYVLAGSQAENLISICRAFENRERLLQTLSANIRKES